jgi:uncharacterized protein YjiS (DUF1127 family)
MPQNFPVVQASPLTQWLQRRAERRMLLKTTDELSQSRDEMLRDMGISRDDIEYAFRSPRSASADLPYGHHGDEQ